jgi:hypothetical protein
MTDERLLAAKGRAAETFFRIPGVTGVGLGGRERDGVPTGELVIKVFVAQKRPPDELTPGETLPSRFEGIGVDVSVLGDVRLEAGPVPESEPPGSPATTDADLDDQDPRPMYGGTRIQVRLGAGGFGSIGGFWMDTDDPNKVYILTNHHVVTNDGADTPVTNVTRVGQATNSDGPSKCCDKLVGTFVAGAREPLRDAALIRLDPGMTYLAEIFQIGVVRGTYDIDPKKDLALAKPYPVRKYGARTRLTGGHVTAVNVELPPDKGVTFSNGMVIRPNPNPKIKNNGRVYFGDGGDSGAAIVNVDNKIVGLHIGGTDVLNEHIGYALPIADIIKRFKDVEKISIAPATATANRDKRTVPTPPKPLVRPPDRAPTGFASAAGRVDTDLAASTAGSHLRALWTEHRAELLDLVDHRRRVTVAWHRGGGPALLHTLIRMAADPGVSMPATVNGVPPMDRITRLHAVFHANASPELRRALDQALTALPDPATLTYDKLLAAIATR